MEGLNFCTNKNGDITSISMALYSEDGSATVTTFELIPSSVRTFFTEGSVWDVTIISESVCGKIITFNPDSDWFNIYSSIEEAVKGQLKDYINEWGLKVDFTEEFQQYRSTSKEC